MGRFLLVTIVMCVLVGCGGSQSSGSATGADGQGDGTPRGDAFQLRLSDTAAQAHGEHPSEIEPTKTDAAMRLFVVNRESGPIEGIVIKLTAPDGTAYYTQETDAQGYGEVLVPVGRRYEIEYLSLGRRNTTANVDVPNEPYQNIRLTLRYRRIRPPAPEPPPQRPAPEQSPEPPPSEEPEQRVVLEGILFDSGRDTIQEDSHPRLDRIVEYMTHRPTTRIRIAGHTDNVGNAQRNQALSEARAQAVREYLISHGIDGDRVEAVGFGDQQPVASNDTEEGRRQNRRIEATEL